MNFVQAFVYILFHVLALAIFARAILSWFPTNPGNQVVAFINQITEPILAPMRRIIPQIGMLDLTPMIAIFILLTTANIIGWPE